ncbi:unnamed protein product [Ranitomeya imitator]|uniref:Uncharacterized protein n=1 Tax=Ranitomeya imitator TaxID=111125 RepID=A0ABN9L3U6_9NEOB|nr:unnamed protein product [Ranitomeya imitator]
MFLLNVVEIPNVQCMFPPDTRYCYSQHLMDPLGESLSVTKSCASLGKCLNTGCRESDLQGHRVCSSCCEGNICNMAVPRNDTDAVFATTSPLSHSQRHSAHSATYLLCLVFTMRLLLTANILRSALQTLLSLSPMGLTM